MTTCELVFNELSVSEPAASVDEARAWLHELRIVISRAIQRTGADGLRVLEGFTGMALGPNYSFAKWRHDAAVDREERSYLARMIDKGKFVTPADPPKVLDEWNDRGVDAEHAGEQVRGLFLAFLLDAFAVSIASSKRWDPPLIELHILRLVESGEEELQTTPVTVRHLSRPEHPEIHGRWLEERDGALAVYRRRVVPREARHVRASEYGKHVRGRTNEERRRNATAPGGDGQFLATLEGRPVTDEVIEAWEREALTAGWEGARDTRVRQHDEGGSTFHLYHERRQPVGYAGRTGAETSRLRVEWSSEQVHSHPRTGGE